MVKPFHIKKVFNNIMCMNKICCENGVFLVNDLISENKMFFFLHMGNLWITIILY
jgi:hypothetical protein